MSSSGKHLQPNKAQNLTTLTKKLLVTWICGLIWGAGSSLFILTLLGWLLSGIATFSNRSAITSWQAFAMGLGLAALVVCPTLVGFYLTKSRRGLISGLLGGIVGTIGIPGLLMFGQALGLGLTAAVIATVILMGTGVSPRRVWGLFLGLVVGLALSVTGGLLGRVSFTEDDSIGLSIVWLASPLIWMSAVYFPELLAGRNGWKGVVVWVLLVLASFVSPFVVYNLLSYVFG